MPLATKSFWHAIILAPLLLAGCCNPTSVKEKRANLVARLQHEMLNQTNWLRIHAAEALLDNGQPAGVAELFEPEVETAAPPYRIGVRRVLARTSSGAERRKYIERIRGVLRDTNATDRVSAAESLGKLNAADNGDSEIISQWLATADDPTSVYPRWLLYLSSSSAEREANEKALAKYLTSSDTVARLRAGFVLGRLKQISPDSTTSLQNQLQREPADSIARVYLITALLFHSTNAADIDALKKQLVPYLNGKPNEQLEAGIVLGIVGGKAEISVLLPYLENPEPDARIGAANGLLRLLK